MKTNDRVEIRKVANGFIVYKPQSHRDDCPIEESTYCFNKMSDLSAFLEKHFEVKNPRQN